MGYCKMFATLIIYLINYEAIKLATAPSGKIKAIAPKD